MPHPCFDSDAEALISRSDSEHSTTRSSLVSTRKAAAGAAAAVAAAVLVAAAALSVCGGFPRPPDQPHGGPKPPVRRLPRWSPPHSEGRLLQLSTERTCTTVVGKDILGDMLGSEVGGQTAGSCRGRCLRNSSCGCYSFDPSRNGTCWLRQKPCNELYTWTETEDMTAGSCRDMRPKVCTQVHGRDVKAEVLIKNGKRMMFENYTGLRCRMRCEKTGGCDCFSFDPSRHRLCWLKSGACDDFYESHESGDMLSGACHEQRPVLDWPVSTAAGDGGELAATAAEPKPGPRRQICTSVHGKDIDGAVDLAVDVNSTASACRSRCASTRRCKGYVFDPSRNHTCWLKKSPCDGDYVVWPETSDMMAGKCREGRPLLDWPLRATSQKQGLLERFRVTQGSRKDSIALLSHHGTYVTAQGDGSVTVDGDSVGDWESFEEVWLEDTRVAFRTFHGGFITATRNGTVSVGESSPSRGLTRPAEEGENVFGHLLDVIADSEEEETETSFFEVVTGSSLPSSKWLLFEDNSVSLKTPWGSFLTAVRLGTADNVVLRGDRDTIGSWATLVLRAKSTHDDAGWLGREVTLQSYLGTYVGVSVSGKVTVTAQASNLTACEEFQLVDGGDGNVALKTCMGTFLSAMEDGSVTADAMKAGDWEHFTIETVNSRLFSALDLPVRKTGHLKGARPGTKLDPDHLSFAEPQSVVFKTFHGGYLFPVQAPKRSPKDTSNDARRPEGWRVIQAMIFTGTCDEAGMMPITDRSTCEATAGRIGPASNSGVDIPEVTDVGVPQGCYAVNQTEFKLGTNSGNHKGVVYREDGTVLNPICSGGCPTCTPPNPTPPAMVILFYERDLCKMKLLAASITKHDPDLLIGTVHLIWLSTHPPGDFMGDIDSIRNAAAASHTVRFHDCSWMFGAGMAGWHTQQIVKLKASGLVEEDYYVVMDAKNALIRDVKPDTFLTPCYQAKVFADTDFDVLNNDAKAWYIKSAGVLGVSIPPGRKWSASITPVVMHTQTVINMLNDLHESPSPLSLCNGALCGHIKGGATEFTLYYLYAATKTEEKCIHREFPRNPAVSMWRGVPDNTGAVTAATNDPSILMFGGQSGSMPDGEAGSRLAGQMQKLFEGAGVHDPASGSAEGMAACVVGG